MVATWVIGAMINVCGSVAINFGINVLKVAHNRNDERKRLYNHSKNNLRSKTWLLGFSVFTMGNLANFLSFGLAAQSLLAGLGSVQFITNVVFAHFVLGERVTARILGATLCIVVGNSFVVAFANQSSQNYLGKELLALYFRQAFVIYAVVLFATVVALQAAYLVLKDGRRHGMIEVSWRFRKRLLPFLYACVSGIVGTQSVILAKSASTLLRTTLNGNNQLTHPFIYGVLAMWLATMVFWLYRMNSALRKFDGIFIIPMLQVVWILFSVLGGGIYFQEFSGLSAMGAVGFTFGIIMVMFGVYLLAPRESSVGTAMEIALSEVLGDNDCERCSDDTTISRSSEELQAQHRQPRLSPETLLSLFAHDAMFGPFELATEWHSYDYEFDCSDKDDGNASKASLPPPSISRDRCRLSCEEGTTVLEISPHSIEVVPVAACDNDRVVVH